MSLVRSIRGLLDLDQFDVRYCLRGSYTSGRVQARVGRHDFLVDTNTHCCLGTRIFLVTYKGTFSS